MATRGGGSTRRNYPAMFWRSVAGCRCTDNDSLLLCLACASPFCAGLRASSPTTQKEDYNLVAFAGLPHNFPSCCSRCSISTGVLPRFTRVMDAGVRLRQLLGPTAGEASPTAGEANSGVAGCTPFSVAGCGEAVEAKGAWAVPPPPNPPVRRGVGRVKTRCCVEHRLGDRGAPLRQRGSAW